MLSGRIFPYSPMIAGIIYKYLNMAFLLSLFLIGGEAIADAFRDSFTPAQLPDKFEAGLQDYAGAIGTQAAIEYLEEIGQMNIINQEHILNAILTEGILNLPGITILGPKEPGLRGNIINFIIKDMDSLALSQLLDETNNIMTRAGMHCAHPWYNAYKLPPSIRISTYFYNTEREAEISIQTLGKLVKHFR